MDLDSLVELLLAGEDVSRSPSITADVLRDLDNTGSPVKMRSKTSLGETSGGGLGSTSGATLLCAHRFS